MKMTKRLATLAACAVMAASSMVGMGAFAAGNTSIASSNSILSQNNDTGYRMTVKLLYQTDSEWNDTVIGTNSSGRTATIASDGCAITCFSMILRYYGLSDATPQTVYNDMRSSAFPSFDFYGAANTFYSDYVSLNNGRTTYENASDNCDNIYFENDTQQQANARSRLYAAIRSGKPVIVGVAKGSSKEANHFVVATGVSTGNAITYINDPSGANSSYATLNQYFDDNYHIARLIIYS